MRASSSFEHRAGNGRHVELFGLTEPGIHTSSTSSASGPGNSLDTMRDGAASIVKKRASIAVDGRVAVIAVLRNGWRRGREHLMLGKRRPGTGRILVASATLPSRRPVSQVSRSPPAPGRARPRCRHGIFHQSRFGVFVERAGGIHRKRVDAAAWKDELAGHEF
jgi:hypothetical protein